MEVPAGTTAAVVIESEVVDDLISALAERGYTVVGPTVRDGAIVLDEVRGRADLPAGWADEQEAGTYRLVRRGDDALFGYAVGPQSPRRFLDPPRRRLWSATLEDGRLRVEPEAEPDSRLALLGVRPCELAAMRVQDATLLHGAHRDPAYEARRRATFVVAVECGSPAATCFCASMGTGPGVGDRHRDADLVLTEIIGPPHHLIAVAGSDRGRDVLDRLASRPATGADLAAARAVVDVSSAQMTRRLDAEAARDVLAANLEHPRWDDVAARCLSCTNCTLVCPTCFCNTVDDVVSLDAQRSERVQRWDSCFTLEHSHLHGSGPVRGDIRSRYRQWLTHKLSTWWNQFGTSGCVGCGRCITWCPARIDLTAEVAALGPLGSPGALGAPEPVEVP